MSGRNLVKRQIRTTAILASLGGLLVVLGGLLNRISIVAIGAVIMVVSPFLSVALVVRSQRRESS